MQNHKNRNEKENEISLQNSNENSLENSNEKKDLLFHLISSRSHRTENREIITQEIMSNTAMFLGAGFETTSNTLVRGIRGTGE